MNFGQTPPNTAAPPSTGFTFGAPAAATGAFSFGGSVVAGGGGESKPPAQVSFGGFGAGETAKPTLFGSPNPAGANTMTALPATAQPRSGAGDSTFTAPTGASTLSQQPTSFGAFQQLPSTLAPTAAAGLSVGSSLVGSGGAVNTSFGATPFASGATGMQPPPSFTATATSTSAAAAPSLSFGQMPPASQPNAQTTNPVQPTLNLTSNAAPIQGGFSFATPTAATSNAAVPSLGGKTLGLDSTANTSLLGKTSASATSTSFAPISLSTETKTTQSSIIKQSQQINFCKLEELVNKWNQALEEQEKLFTNQATQLNAWDQLLIENGEKLVGLNEAVEKVKAEQTAVEQELEFISAQHIELEECILPLQKELAKTPQIDVERSQIYSIAENLDTQLKQMTEDLKAVIEQLNEANKAQDPNDPIVQIGRILNAHLNSMQWIETSTSLIGSKLDDITKVHEIIRRDNEKTMRRYFH